MRVRAGGGVSGMWGLGARAGGELEGVGQRGRGPGLQGVRVRGGDEGEAYRKWVRLGVYGGNAL